jgi:hypothetical protein
MTEVENLHGKLNSKGAGVPPGLVYRMWEAQPSAMAGYGVTREVTGEK